MGENSHHKPTLQKQLHFAVFLTFCSISAFLLFFFNYIVFNMAEYVVCIWFCTWLFIFCLALKTISIFLCLKKLSINSHF